MTFSILVLLPLTWAFLLLIKKNKVFYFATNYLSSFVYVADVANKKLLAPIVTGLTFVNNINWDPSTNSIFIDGYFQSEDNSKYYTIFQYNTLDGSLRSIATFTNQVLVESTVDWKNGLYYFTDSSSLYTLQISNGFNITTAPVNCSDANTSYFIGYLYYDNVNLQLIGAGRDTNSILSYGYFTLSSKGSCKVTLLDLPQGVVLSHAFDPVNQNLYLGYAGPIALFTCDVKSGNLTQLDLSIYLNDVAVTFKV